MKYTFLLPAYKARFFREALGSILNQTYSDFSVIVSDDCSTEDLRTIVDEFGDPRVQYRRNEHNIGAEHLADHWNLLLGLTDSDYIILASDDDIYDACYLEEMDKLRAMYPEVDVLRPLIQKIDSEGKIIGVDHRIEKQSLSREEYLALFASEAISSGIPQYLFKRQTLLDSGGFVDFPAAWFSDDATVMRMAKNGVAVAGTYLFSFRVSDISISTGSQTLELVKNKIDASILYVDFCMSCGLADCNRLIRNGIVSRTRRITIYALKRLVFKDFLKSLVYTVSKHSYLYPVTWCVRRFFDYIYHDIIMSHFYKHEFNK